MLKKLYLWLLPWDSASISIPIIFFPWGWTQCQWHGTRKTSGDWLILLLIPLGGGAITTSVKMPAALSEPSTIIRPSSFLSLKFLPLQELFSGVRPSFLCLCYMRDRACLVTSWLVTQVRTETYKQGPLGQAAPWTEPLVPLELGICCGSLVRLKRQVGTRASAGL